MESLKQLEGVLLSFNSLSVLSQSSLEFQGPGVHPWSLCYTLIFLKTSTSVMFLMHIRFSLLLGPLIIEIFDLAVPSFFDNTLIHSVFAFPSTGGDVRYIFIIPESSH